MLQLNYVRDELTAALLTVSKSARNQIVVMAESAAGSDRFMERPMREIDVDKSVVLVEAEPVRCSAGRRYKTSSVLVSPAVFQHVSWRQAIHKLPEQYGAWLNYCYGDSTSFEHQTILTAHLWNSLKVHQDASGEPAMSEKTRKNFQALAWLAVQESKTLINRGQARYGQEALSQLCGVTWANWRKRYQSRWKVILECGAQLDREALIYVEQLRKAAASCKR